MFSKDEMRRAIEDALRSMEGVALELYRRGREESREELETVKRERDEARADAERYLADLRRCASEPYEHAKERAAAYRRGAEAMREACAREASVCANHRGEELADILSALPTPEEP